MTDFIEPLCEKREDEIAYTKAYIENMYVYYGYGMWLVCDRENGEIIERGDHEDLLKEKGRYYRLYTGMAELN